MFDPANTVIGEENFVVHKDTGERVVVGDHWLHLVPIGKKVEAFPKWVTPHVGHIVRTEGHVSTPAFPEFHVARDGAVTVLVADAEAEAKALAEPKAEAKAEEKAEAKPAEHPAA